MNPSTETEKNLVLNWEPSLRHFQETRNYPFKHDDPSNLDYFLQFVGGTVVLVFEATVDKKDWRSGFDYYAKSIRLFDDDPLRLKVHEGIWKQYLGIRNRFLEMCYSSEVKNILISGYSLGGGLAQIAAEDAAWHFSPFNSKWNGDVKNIRAVSYDGPRVWGRSRVIKRLLADRLKTVKTHNDPVVHVPFKVMVAPFFKFYLFPFSIKPSFFEVSFWKDYGKVVWIGKRFRFIPLQHLPDQIDRALLEKFGV